MPKELRQFESKSCGSTHKALTPNKNTRNKQSHQTLRGEGREKLDYFQFRENIIFR